jgi:hypothetical protein
MYGATTFDCLIASDEILEVFAIPLNDCAVLLGATMKAITKGERSPWDRPCEHAQQREL